MSGRESASKCVLSFIFSGKLSLGCLDTVALAAATGQCYQQKLKCRAEKTVAVMVVVLLLPPAAAVQ